MLTIDYSMNNQPHLRFLDCSTGNERTQIWNWLLEGGYRSLYPCRHEENILSGVLRRESWRPVLGDWLPVHPGMAWDSTRKQLVERVFKPESWQGGLTDFIEIAESFFARFSGRRLGVQLSGGLDSSLIIALLHHLGIDYGLVGMTTERYEFRTERYIQKLLADRCGRVALLDYESHMPMSDLKTVPPHQYPDLACLNFGDNHAMAKKCKELDIEVLFSGDGGDIILGLEAPEDPQLLNWPLQVFGDQWLNDIVYAPNGVELVPFFGDSLIATAFWHLRRGQEADTPKQWARNFFRELLPQQLVKYSYCADFWGICIDDLQSAIPAMRQLHEIAAELTGHRYFAEAKLEAALNQDLLQCEKARYQRLEARLSLVVWLNSLGQILSNSKPSEPSFATEIGAVWPPGTG